MSIHNSLHISAGMNRIRNVMTRAERIEVMKNVGAWKDGTSVYGLPKTKVAVRVKKAKAVKKEEKPAEAK